MSLRWEELLVLAAAVLTALAAAGCGSKEAPLEAMSEEERQQQLERLTPQQRQAIEAMQQTQQGASQTPSAE